MKAARLKGPKSIEIDEIPAPVLRPGAVAIDVAWREICGTDLHEHLDDPIFNPAVAHPHPLTHEQSPVTMGHEFSGTVTAIGAGITDLTAGEHVVVERRWVHPIGNIPVDEAALIEPLSAVLKAEGRTVIISELSQVRKDEVLSTGVADHVPDPSEEDVPARVLEITDGRDADVCLESSSVDAVTFAGRLSA